MSRRSLNTSPIPQGAGGAMLSSVSSAVTDQERSTMLSEAGLDESYLSTTAPMWSYALAVGIIGLSAFVAKRIAESEPR